MELVEEKRFNAMKKDNFELTYNKHIKQLQMFVPVVQKVHGKHHPEFYDVKKIFDEMTSKVDKGHFDLSKTFERLRETTNNYEVPSDVCETYEAVYQMLASLDQAFDNDRR